MTDPAKKADPNDETMLSLRDWRLEATILNAHTQEADEADILCHTKQMHDLALAVAMRDSGLLTEGQLALATRDWTVFGTSTLAEHVLANGLANDAQIKDAQMHASKLYSRAAKMTPSLTSTGSKLQRNLTTALNPDGRLASLMCLTGSSSMIGEEIEDRIVGARYTLLRKLGQGGLGTVWLASDVNLNRYVAVKELTADAQAGDLALEQFRREAEITGRLEHPGIVPIYQFGHDEKSGKAFYAMRFLGRRTLLHAIDEYHERHEAGVEAKMLLHRLLSSFVSVCHSVGHAHAQKVIHRDLKPTNVALDEFGQVTLLDWGLSKVNEETGVYDVAGRSEPGDLHDMSSTYFSRVIGTPLYMAPEQAAGRLEDVDELTDVYGLGGILYTILTGVGPHHASAETSETIEGREQFLSRIVSGDVIAPKERKSIVRPELDAICLKALARQKYRRYQSAAELADDVQRYMAGTPVHAYEAPLKRRFSRWMMRHPTLAQMLLLSASLIMIGLIAVALTAHAGRERLIIARFASAVETAHDMEVNLQFEAHALERDLHFITELPLMSAITQSQGVWSQSESISKPIQEASSETNEPLLDDAGSTSTALDHKVQSPQQWLDRQGELFDGFLDANPSYLMMASCSRENEHQFRELVRSERVSAGQRAFRVPKLQLRTTKSTSGTSDSDFLELLRPGAAFLVTNDQFSDDIPTNHRSPLVLSGVSAIYNNEGDFFGINIIELDLRERLRSLLPAIAPEYVNVIITDALGYIVMDYRNGRFLEVTSTRMAVSEFSELNSLFNQASESPELSDDRRFYAKLVRLGEASSRAKIGIVVYTSDQ